MKAELFNHAFCCLSSLKEDLDWFCSLMLDLAVHCEVTACFAPVFDLFRDKIIPLALELPKLLHAVLYLVRRATSIEFIEHRRTDGIADLLQLGTVEIVAVLIGLDGNRAVDDLAEPIDLALFRDGDLKLVTSGPAEKQAGQGNQ